MPLHHYPVRGCNTPFAAASVNGAEMAQWSPIFLMAAVMENSLLPFGTFRPLAGSIAPTSDVLPSQPSLGIVGQLWSHVDLTKSNQNED